MHIILYESSSKGGCYKYALELFHAYQKHPEVSTVKLLLPSNANIEGAGIYKHLLGDNKTGNKLNFLARHFINPLILWWFIKRQPSKVSKTFVLLNDFEQLSAPFWSPLYRFTVSKQFLFGLFLHDADRDNYPPSPKISAWCMRQMMKCIHLGLHHSSLPQRKYYRNNGKTNYLSVNHGLYHLPPPESDMAHRVHSFVSSYNLSMAIIGHIRHEKNYMLAFEALVNNPHHCLVIAGSAANSQVNVEALKQQAKHLGIEERVLWINHYLSEAEMTAVIASIDWVLLYYASSFHAQSGILNQTAPLRKPVLVSDLPNALTETVKHYKLGLCVPADNSAALSDAIESLPTQTIVPLWDTFFKEVDWQRQVDKVMDKLQNNNLPFR